MPCPYCLTDDCSQTAIFATAKTVRIADLQASIAALGNRGKAERERYVASELLLNLGVPFLDVDIKSVAPRDEPPDVTFDIARFEVKELYDPERLRIDEYRQRLLEAQAARQCLQLRPTTPFTPTETTAGAVLALAVNIGAQYCAHYAPALVRTLDLLLYHNLVDVIGMPDETFPDTAALAHQGWRSVSVLFGHRAIVFCAAANAPPWLRGAAGAVVHRT